MQPPSATLPPPSAIVKTLLVQPANGRGGLAYYAMHTWVTAQAAVLGLLALWRRARVPAGPPVAWGPRREVLAGALVLVVSAVLLFSQLSYAEFDYDEAPVVTDAVAAILGNENAPYALLNLSLNGTLLPNTFSAKQAEYAVLRQWPLVQRIWLVTLQPFVGAQALLLPGLGMLAAAFGGRDLIMKAYKKAIKEGYRFFSYGDATLIL